MLHGDNHPTRAALASAREQTMHELSEAFAQDQLSLEELEQRMESAQECGSVAELRALTRDLQPSALEVRVQSPAPLVQAIPGGTSLSTPVPASIPATWVLLGSVERRLTGPAPAELSAHAVFGDVQLDLTDAEFAPGITVLHANALCGSVEVHVPANIHVDCQSTAVLGSVEGPRGSASAPPDAPVLQVRGLSLLGSVEVRKRRSLPHPE